MEAKEKDTPRECVRGEGRRKDAADGDGEREKKGRGGFQERIEGESNLLRRTHTRFSVLLRPTHPPGSPITRTPRERTQCRWLANTCTSPR